MKEFCDDLNKALPGITGHLQGWQLMLVNLSTFHRLLTFTNCI